MFLLIIKIYKLLQKFNINFNIFSYYKLLLFNFDYIEEHYKLNNQDFYNLIESLKTYLDKNLKKALNVKYVIKNNIPVGIKNNNYLNYFKDFFSFLNIELMQLDIEKIFNKDICKKYYDIRDEYKAIYFNIMLNKNHYMMRDLISNYKQKEFNELCKYQIKKYDNKKSIDKKLEYLLDTYIILSDDKIYKTKNIFKVLNNTFQECLFDFISEQK